MGIPENTTEFWTCVGAAGAIITALMSVCVAVIAARYSKRQATVNATINLNNSWNTYNAFLLTNPAVRKQADKYRGNIYSSEEDRIIFMELNLYEACYVTYNSGFFSKKYNERMMKNLIHTFSHTDISKMKTLLNRGYDPRFTADLLRGLEAHRKDNPDYHPEKAESVA